MLEPDQLLDVSSTLSKLLTCSAVPLSLPCVSTSDSPDQFCMPGRVHSTPLGPLSILAMYVMSWSAASFTMRAAPVLFSCYADNWEIIGDRSCHVATAVDQLQQFAGAMRLSFAPEKCWSWAFGPDARKQVAITWLGASIPCKRDAVNLGADSVYPKEKSCFAQ